MKTLSAPIDHHQTLNQRFQEILPQIRKCAEYFSRDMRQDDREEAVQDVITQSYFAYCRMCRQGRKDRVFPTALAKFAIRRYRTGRKASGTVRKRDLSRAMIERVDGSGHQVRIRRRSSRWLELLVEDRRTPIPDQVSFRVDFPEWLRSLSICQRKVAEMFATGDRPVEVALALEVSTARVSQIRKELRDNWEDFHERNLVAG